MQSAIHSIPQKFQIFATGESIDLFAVTSAKEKSALEILSIFEEDKAFEEVCKVYLPPECQNFPEELKLALLAKVHEISNGSDCKIKFKCPNCKNITESVIMLENLVSFENFEKPEVQRFQHLKLKDPLKVGVHPDLQMTQISEVFEDAKAETLVDLKELLLAYRARLPVFKREVSCRCVLCQHENWVRLDKDFILKSLSEYSLSSMYQVYNKLVINGFSKSDVDEMLPFERDVHAALIDKAIEDRKPKPSNSQTG